MNLAFFRSAALLALFVAGCADNTEVTPPGRIDAGFDAATPVDAGTADAGPGDAGPADAGPIDAGPPDAGPPDAGPPDAGPPDAGPDDAGPAVCPFGEVSVCSANVAGGTQVECTANLTRMVNICRAAGWLWTGDTVCVVGGSPSSTTAFGGDGTCSH